MISLLCPTRNRLGNIERLWCSIVETVDDISDIELILYVDDDDHSYDGLDLSGNFKVITGPRIVLSECWNRAYEASSGDILMHLGDDIIMRTKGWDTVVKAAFDEYPDHIVFIYGSDGGPMTDFGTHGFIHRKWAKTVGYFVPPYYSSDYNDTHLNDVAKMLGRHRRVDIFTEHMHPAFHKAEWDITHQERLARHNRDRVDELYHSVPMQEERKDNARKLKEVIDGTKVS